MKIGIQLFLLAQIFLVMIACSPKIQEKYTIITTQVDSVHSIEFRDQSGAFVKEMILKNARDIRTVDPELKEEITTTFSIKQHGDIAVIDERRVVRHLKKNHRIRPVVAIDGNVSIVSNRGKVVWEKAYHKPDTCFSDRSLNKRWELSIHIARESDLILVSQGAPVPLVSNYAYAVTGKGMEIFDLSSVLDEPMGLYHSIVSYKGEYLGFLLNKTSPVGYEKLNLFYHIPSEKSYFDKSGKVIRSIWDTGLVDFQGTEKSTLNLKTYLNL